MHTSVSKDTSVSILSRNNCLLSGPDLCKIGEWLQWKEMEGIDRSCCLYQATLTPVVSGTLVCTFSIFFNQVACNVSQSFPLVIASNMNDAGPVATPRRHERLPLAVRNAGIVINAPSSLQLFSLPQVQGGPARMAQQELHRTAYDFLAFTCVEITGASLHPGCALGTCSSAGAQVELHALFERTRAIHDRNAYKQYATETSTILGCFPDATYATQATQELIALWAWYGCSHKLWLHLCNLCCNLCW